MEHSDSISTKQVEFSKKGSIRRSRASLFNQSQSSITQNKRPINFLLILLFLGISKKFDEKQIIKKQQIEYEQNQKQLKNQQNNSQNSLRMSMSINPIHRKIREINSATVFIKSLHQQCEKYLNINAVVYFTLKKQRKNSTRFMMEEKRKSVNAIEKQKITDLPSQIYNEKENIQINKSLEISRTKYQRKIGNLRVTCHQRICSDISDKKSIHYRRQFSTTTNQFKIKNKLLPSYNNSNKFQRNQCKDRQECVKTVSNCYTEVDYSSKSIFPLIQLFLQGIHKTTYTLNIFSSKHNSFSATSSDIFSKKHEQIPEQYKFKQQIEEISVKFMKIKEICESIGITQERNQVFMKDEKSKTKQNFFKPYQNKFTSYLNLSNQIVDSLRSLLNSIYFQKVVQNHKQKIKQLVTVIYDTRFTLKYLEKEIENCFFHKRTEPLILKWQKAYKNKFLPKRIYI